MAGHICGLLAAIRSDVDLWEASDEDLAAVDPLWDVLLRMPGVGTATASKLLARKRPRLCPVSDKVVIQAAGVPGWTWEALRCLLQDPAARADVEALRPLSADARQPAADPRRGPLDTPQPLPGCHPRAAGHGNPRATTRPP